MSAASVLEASAIDSGDFAGVGRGCRQRGIEPAEYDTVEDTVVGRSEWGGVWEPGEECVRGGWGGAQLPKQHSKQLPEVPQKHRRHRRALSHDDAGKARQAGSSRVSHRQICCSAMLVPMIA